MAGGTLTRIINGVIRTVRIDGSASISSSATSVVVTFPATLQTGNSSPNIIAVMINTTDTNPKYQPINISARSSTGFTANWSDATDTANYVLAYQVADGWKA